MSQYQQKDNSGALFKNEKKAQPAQPDYDGTVIVGGIEYRIAAWLKSAESGRKFMSLAFTPKQEQPAPARQAPAKARSSDPALDDDIPF
jgi:uncharacterized protein (DUF736 family)